MLKAETKPTSQAGNILCMWCGPAPEIEIAGFNLPDNDRKLERPRNSLWLEAASCPLNRTKINFTCACTSPPPPHSAEFYLFKQLVDLFNKQFPTSLPFSPTSHEDVTPLFKSSPSPPPPVLIGTLNLLDTESANSGIESFISKKGGRIYPIVGKVFQRDIRRYFPLSEEGVKLGPLPSIGKRISQAAPFRFEFK